MRQSIGGLIDSILPRPFQSVAARVTQEAGIGRPGRAARFVFVSASSIAVFRQAIIFEHVPDTTVPPISARNLWPDTVTPPAASLPRRNFAWPSTLVTSPRPNEIIRARACCFRQSANTTHAFIVDPLGKTIRDTPADRRILVDSFGFSWVAREKLNRGGRKLSADLLDVYGIFIMRQFHVEWKVLRS